MMKNLGMKLQVIAITLVIALMASAELLDDGRVSVVLLPGNFDLAAPTGNRHFSFRVGNHSNSTREIALTLFTRGPYVTVRRSAKIPAGESVVMTLVYPMPAYNSWKYNNPALEVNVDGKSFMADSTTASIHSSSRDYSASPNALCSTSVPSEEFEAIYGNHSESYTGLYSFIRSPLSMSEWSGDVSDYMNYKVIWVTAEETIPPDVEKALRKWVFNGGKLIRCVMGEWPSDLKYNFPKNKPEKYCHEERLGFGSIMTFKPYLGKNDGVADFARKVRDKGHSFWNPQMEKHPACVYLPHSLRELLMTPKQRMVTPHEDKGSTAGEAFRIEEPTTPLGMLVLIMTVFVLIVGPLNYIYLMKHGHTALMVVTIPLISIVFCVLVFSFVAISSGFALRGKVYGFTFLNQEDKLASTCAHVSLMAPNMTRRDLVFDTNDHVCLYHEGFVNVLDKPGMQIDSSYIPVRTTLNYTVNRCDTTGERVKVNRPGEGKVEIVNGLSASLLHFLYCDYDGRLYYAENVPEGQRVELEALSKENAPEITLSRKEIADVLEKMRKEGHGSGAMTEEEELKLAKTIAEGMKHNEINRLAEARDALEAVLLKSPTNMFAIRQITKINKKLGAMGDEKRQAFLDDSRKIVFETLFRDIADGKETKQAFLSALQDKLPPNMYVVLTNKPMFYSPGLVPDKGEIYHLVLGDMKVTPPAAHVEW